VSLATASRVLNPDSDYGVSPALRERVRAAAEELDYSSNALARGLKTQRTRTVAVIVHDIRDPYFNETARGVTDAAEEADYLTVICNTDRDLEMELKYVQLVQEHRVSGVLFVGGGFDNARYRAAMRRRLAAIRAYGGYAIALGPRGDRIPADVPDNTGGARAATEHLLELGHERIAFLGGPPGLRTTADRELGYRSALEAAGLAVDDALIVDGDYSDVGGMRATAGLLDGDAPFTALFASNDAMALGALQELNARGLRVPSDLSLVGFDDISIARWLDPPLTTVAVPMTEIGRAGMQRLLALLDADDGGGDGDKAGNGRRAPQVTVHETKLIVRGSTAPPSAVARGAGA
jgi:LacI family transcriptional regulator